MFCQKCAQNNTFPHTFCLSAFINPAAIRADVEPVCSAHNRCQNINTMYIQLTQYLFLICLYGEHQGWLLWVYREKINPLINLRVRKNMRYCIQSRKVLVLVFILPMHSPCFPLMEKPEHKNTLQVDRKSEFCSWT